MYNIYKGDCCLPSRITNIISKVVENFFLVPFSLYTASSLTFFSEDSRVSAIPNILWTISGKTNDCSRSNLPFPRVSHSETTPLTPSPIPRLQFHTNHHVLAWIVDLGTARIRWLRSREDDLSFWVKKNNGLAKGWHFDIKVWYLTFVFKNSSLRTACSVSLRYYQPQESIYLHNGATRKRTYRKLEIHRRYG